MADLPTSSIDIILCDLPYGTTANAWDKVIPFEYLWGQYERLIKPQGAIVLTATERFSADLVQSKPALYRYKWVWIKNTVTNFVNAKNRPLSRFEEILVFSKAGTANFGNSPDTKGMNYFPKGCSPIAKPSTRVSTRTQISYTRGMRPTRTRKSGLTTRLTYSTTSLIAPAGTRHKSPSIFLPTSSRLTPSRAKSFWIIVWGLAPPRLPQWTLTAISSAMKLAKNTGGAPLTASSTTTQPKLNYSDSSLMSRSPLTAPKQR